MPQKGGKQNNENTHTQIKGEKRAQPSESKHFLPLLNFRSRMIGSKCIAPADDDGRWNVWVEGGYYSMLRLR
jgi:hypothetical protein